MISVVQFLDGESTKRELLPGAFVDSVDAKTKLLKHLVSLIQYVEHEETTIYDATYLGHIARTFEDLVDDLESTDAEDDEDLPRRLFTRGMIWEIEPDLLLIDLVAKNDADVQVPKATNDD